jgi:hypothetical protein
VRWPLRDDDKEFFPAIAVQWWFRNYYRCTHAHTMGGVWGRVDYFGPGGAVVFKSWQFNVRDHNDAP